MLEYYEGEALNLRRILSESELHLSLVWSCSRYRFSDVQSFVYDDDEISSDKE